MRKLLCTVALLISAQLHSQFIINQNAYATGNECYVLTDPQAFQVGTIWNQQMVDLSKSFKIDFKLNFGTIDANGADGIAFSIQQVSTSVGVAGGGIGYENIKPSITVEFDTWQNASRNDPSYDHVSIMQDGNLDHNGVTNLSGPAQIDPNNVNVEDGLWKEISIEWNADSNELKVLYDCAEQISYKGDIVNDIFSNDPMAFWGFTSATGGSVNLQQVCVTIQTLNQDQNGLGCSDTVALNGPNGAVSYQWSPDLYMSNDTVEDPTVSPLDTTKYYLDYVDRCGKSWTDSTTVNVTNILPVKLPSDTAVCSELAFVMDVTNSPLATYDWSTGGVNSSISISDSGYYKVVVTVGECSDSADVNISLKECKIWVPNIFTPNGDGRNDMFEIVNFQEADRLHVKIYNRWGRRVYENEDYQNNWNGTLHGDGSDVADGVYYYVIFAEGADYDTYNGFVTLMR